MPIEPIQSGGNLQQLDAARARLAQAHSIARHATQLPEANGALLRLRPRMAQGGPVPDPDADTPVAVKCPPPRHDDQDVSDFGESLVDATDDRPGPNIHEIFHQTRKFSQLPVKEAGAMIAQWNAQFNWNKVSPSPKPSATNILDAAYNLGDDLDDDFNPIPMAQVLDGDSDSGAATVQGPRPRMAKGGTVPSKPTSLPASLGCAIKSVVGKAKSWMQKRYGLAGATKAMVLGQVATWGASAGLSALTGLPILLPPGTGILTGLAAAEISHRLRSPEDRERDEREYAKQVEGTKTLEKLPQYPHMQAGGKIPSGANETSIASGEIDLTNGGEVPQLPGADPNKDSVKATVRAGDEVIPKHKVDEAKAYGLPPAAAAKEESTGGGPGAPAVKAILQPGEQVVTKEEKDARSQLPESFGAAAKLLIHRRIGMEKGGRVPWTGPPPASFLDLVTETFGTGEHLQIEDDNTVGVNVHGRLIQLGYDPKSKLINTAFFHGEGQEPDEAQRSTKPDAAEWDVSAKSLQPGSLQLMRSLKKFAAGAKSAGMGILYQASERRADLYGKMLSNLSFENKFAGEMGEEGVAPFVWRKDGGTIPEPSEVLRESRRVRMEKGGTVPDAPPELPESMGAAISRVVFKDKPKKKVHHESLREIVKAQGGIDPESARPFDTQALRESGLAGLFRKGGAQVDLLVSSLHDEGHIYVPGTTYDDNGGKVLPPGADEYLIAQLVAGAKSLHAQESEDERIEREMAEAAEQEHERRQWEERQQLEERQRDPEKDEAWEGTANDAMMRDVMAAQGDDAGSFDFGFNEVPQLPESSVPELAGMHEPAQLPEAETAALYSTLPETPSVAPAHVDQQEAAPTKAVQPAAPQAADAPTQVEQPTVALAPTKPQQLPELGPPASILGRERASSPGPLPESILGRGRGRLPQPASVGEPEPAQAASSPPPAEPPASVTAPPAAPEPNRRSSDEDLDREWQDHLKKKKEEQRRIEDARVRAAARDAVASHRDEKGHAHPRQLPVAGPGGWQPSWLQQAHAQRQELPSLSHAIIAQLVGRKTQAEAARERRFTAKERRAAGLGELQYGYEQSLSKDLVRLFLPQWAETLGFNELIPVAERPPLAMTKSAQEGPEKRTVSFGAGFSVDISELPPDVQASILAEEAKVYGSAPLPATMGEAIGGATADKRKLSFGAGTSIDMSELPPDVQQAILAEEAKQRGETTAAAANSLPAPASASPAQQQDKMDKATPKAGGLAARAWSSLVGMFGGIGSLGGDGKRGLLPQETPGWALPGVGAWSPCVGRLPEIGESASVGSLGRGPRSSSVSAGGGSLTGGEKPAGGFHLPSLAEASMSGLHGGGMAGGSNELVAAIKELVGVNKELVAAVKKLSDAMEKGGRHVGKPASGGKDLGIGDQGAKSTFDLLKRAVAGSGNEMIGRAGGSAIARSGVATAGGAAQGAGAVAGEATAAASGAAATATAARVAMAAGS